MCKNGTLRVNLEHVKMGQYTRIERAFSLLSIHNVYDLDMEFLETFPGIGSKTSRFFFLHSFPDQKIAVLDTHILSWMREKGYKGVPKSTPSGMKYKEIEAWFLLEACIRNMAPAELDLEIWKSRSQKNSKIKTSMI